MRCLGRSPGESADALPHHWHAPWTHIGIHSSVVDAREWSPVGPQAVALRRAMACSPCFLERPEDCPRGITCLSDLAVADVYQACRQALARVGLS
jgi:hypothetical protein